MRRCIYTAIVGPYDPPRIPTVVDTSVDYLCFTDRPEGVRAPWQARPLVWSASERGEYGRCLTARWHKMLSTVVVPEYDQTIWCDGSIQWTARPTELWGIVGDATMACHDHLVRKTVSEEVEACAFFDKDEPDILRAQGAAYREAGFPDDVGLTASGIVVRAARPGLAAVEVAWWSELYRWSLSDQIGLAFIAWKHGLSVATIPGEIYRTPWYTVERHSNARLIDAHRENKKNERSDIHEHLNRLYLAARKADVVVELGVRSGQSTVSLLAAGAEVVSVDDESWDAPVTQRTVTRIKEWAGNRFTYTKADSRKIQIPTCDILFVDTLHEGVQLAEELEAHHARVRKAIYLHDTETYGEVGERGGQGLLPAIATFLCQHPEWRQTAHFTNNNGLTILTRNS